MKALFVCTNFILIILFLSCSQSNLCETGDCTPTTFETPTLIIDYDMGEFWSDDTRLFGKQGEPNRFLSTSIHLEEMQLLAKSLLGKEDFSSDYLSNLEVSSISYMLSPNFFAPQEKVHVSNEDVLGFAIHYYDSKKKMYRLISRGKPTSRCDIDSEVSNISTNHLWQINSCLNFSPAGDIVFLSRKVSSKDRPTRYKSTIPRDLKFVNEEKVPDPSERYCSSPCHNKQGAACIVEDGPVQPVYICLLGSCLVTSSEDTVKYYSPSDRENYLLNKLYKFRDSYLAQSTKGLKYVDDYYELSEEPITSFSFPSLYSITVLSPGLLSKFDKLVKYKEGNTSLGSEILYNSQFGSDVTDANYRN